MKKGQKKKKYSPKFKKGIILDMREHRLNYRETARKYWEDSKEKESNHIKQVQRWGRIYLEEGAEGIMKERQERLPKLDKKIEKDLIEENQHLRMEIEYLKN